MIRKTKFLNVQNTIKKMAIALLAMLPPLLMPGAAHADIAEVVGHMTAQAPAVVKGITVLAYLGGAIFGYIFITNMRKYAEDARSVNGGVKSLVITLLAAIFLLWFPSTIQIGADSVLGGGAQSQGISGTQTLTR